MQGRKLKHFSNARNKKQCEYSVIAKAIRKYGEENFIFEVVEENIPLSQLDSKEIFYIKKFNSLIPYGYNITTGGKTGFKNSSLDNEEILKLYRLLKSTRLVAEQLNVSHDCISKRLKGMNVNLFSPREQLGKEVILEKDGTTLKFPSKPDCAEWLIENNFTSAKVESIRSKLRNNSYYLGYKVTIN